MCFRLFYEPVTTPCGHVFCRSCLNRSLDHQPDCPICRRSLSQVLASRNQNITHAIEKLMQRHLADEYEERKQIHLTEMEKLASVASNTEDDIPIFVCTMAFPSMPCPLHIFEPRYRLMVRQCMESGSKQFGMCVYDEDKGKTIGGRRFKVLSKGKRDGYSVAKVEWIADEPVPKKEEGELKSLIREVFDEASNWFNMLPLLIRRRIVNSVSEMPHWEDNADKLPHGPKWLWWLITVCPLDSKAQLSMLGLKSLKQRMLTMRRILAAIS
ncbi:hypothetical protein QZH41_018240 [Actinostola sp. cb2023]|nr:hypothetical protein QZH41_018240 [Actinostola sp. cb2023]